MNKLRAYNKAYYKANRKKILENAKSWYENNKNHVLENSKLYRENNKELIKERKRVYFKNNQEKIQAKRRKDWIENKNNVQERTNKCKRKLVRDKYSKDDKWLHKRKVREFARYKLKKQLLTDIGCCQVCNSIHNLQTHHVDYKFETTNVMLLCKPCHLLIHKVIKSDDE